MMVLVVVVVVVVVAVLRSSKRRSVKAEVGAPGRPVDAELPPIWPSTVVGRLGVAVLGVEMLAETALLSVPFLGLAALVVALVLTSVARFALHDRSAAVLVAWVASLVVTVFWTLFLLGEVFIGHE